MYKGNNYICFTSLNNILKSTFLYIIKTRNYSIKEMKILVKESKQNP